ncbi:MAG: hypothetical protein P8J24_11655 [Arenicellales bacterium]|nr:hypothetical protein [Arenicellales bacterium]
MIHRTEHKGAPWLACALEVGCEIIYGTETVDGQCGGIGRHMGLDIKDSPST